MAIKERLFGAVVARLVSKDFVAIADETPGPKRLSFDAWIVRLGRRLLSQFLMDHGFVVEKRASSDVCLEGLLTFRQRVFALTAPSPKGRLEDLIQFVSALGPLCDPDGHLRENPADFYPQAVFTTTLGHLKQVFEREAGIATAILLGAGALPTFLKDGKPTKVGQRFYLSIATEHLIPALELPPLLKELMVTMKGLTPKPP
ncbi:MAG: hypothetical protein NZ959_03815 [Armatimonadetes bacterium]|nr:hypothetical protein [Armatimonadota bacterium]